MKKLFVFAFVLAFCACKDSVIEKSVVVSYDLKSPVEAEVFSQSYYATMEGEIDHVGTVTSTYFINEYTQNGNMLYLNRTFISDASKGYLKKSYPGELALRAPNFKLTAENLNVTDIIGYENFDSSVIAKVSIPDRWRNQIIKMTRQIDLDRLEKKRWDITHLLQGEVPLHSNITNLLNSTGRIPNMPFASIDSVITKGIKRINNVKCLEYTVYLQEKELFPYFIWEQHVSSVKSGMPFKNYHHKDAYYQNRYEVALNLENGIPCQEREFKFGTHGMQNPETGDSVTFQSQISHERLYTIK